MVASERAIRVKIEMELNPGLAERRHAELEAAGELELPAE
jgi:hypothetical protein